MADFSGMARRLMALIASPRGAMPAAPPPTFGIRGPGDRNAAMRAEELRRQMGVDANTPGGQQTDAALKAIEDALKYGPR